MIKTIDSLQPPELQTLLDEWIAARTANPEDFPGDNLAFLKCLQAMKQHWLEQPPAQIIQP